MVLSIWKNKEWNKEYLSIYGWMKTGTPLVTHTPLSLEISEICDGVGWPTPWGWQCCSGGGWARGLSAPSPLNTVRTAEYSSDGMSCIISTPWKVSEEGREKRKLNHICSAMFRFSWNQPNWGDSYFLCILLGCLQWWGCPPPSFPLRFGGNSGRCTGTCQAQFLEHSRKTDPQWQLWHSQEHQSLVNTCLKLSFFKILAGRDGVHLQSQHLGEGGSL